MLFFQQKVFPLFFYLFCSSVCIFNIFYGFSYLLEVSFQPWIGPDASASAPRSFVARLVKIVSFFLRWLMGDRVKALRRENDHLKRQLNELKKEFQSIKSKMAEQKDCHEAAATAVPNTQDVQFLSDSYDALVKSESSLSRALEIFLVGWIYWQLTLTELTKLSTTVTNITWRSWAFHSSRKANLKQDTAELCVKLFSGLGVDVSMSEIHIAHRVPQRDTSTGNGNRRQPNPISFKCTRKMTRDTVLASRGNASRLTTKDLDLPSTAEINRIAIYSHLTPRLLELLHSAKAHQNTYNYKWCWAKGAAIFLGKTDSSMTIRLRSIDNLTKLRMRERPEAWSEDPCS